MGISGYFITRGLAAIGAKYATPVRSTTLTVTLGEKTITLSETDIKALSKPIITGMTTGFTDGSHEYDGIRIEDLLDKLGLPMTKENEDRLSQMYFIAEGSNGNRALVSCSEAVNSNTAVIVANAVDKKPLERDGAFKLIVSGDNSSRRWISNLKSITFKTGD